MHHLKNTNGIVPSLEQGRIFLSCRLDYVTMVEKKKEREKARCAVLSSESEDYSSLDALSCRICIKQVGCAVN